MLLICSKKRGEFLEIKAMLILVAKFPTQIDRKQRKKEV